MSAAVLNAFLGGTRYVICQHLLEEPKSAPSWKILDCLRGNRIYLHWQSGGCGNRRIEPARQLQRIGNPGY